MIGTSLGPYKIIEQLGAGGMGEVYLGEDTRLGRKVAIKVLPAEFASDPERLARFEQEARAAAALNHPHIAVVHDIGAEGDTHFMVQEYLEGQSLRERLQKGALPLDNALDLATEVGEALVAAHAAGIVHRDLKPDNIFVTEQGHAKVLDFGLAKLMETAAPTGSQASMSPTALGTVAGQVMGTAGYMAPEQAAGDAEIDHRADLFAFGCVLYEMATGAQPFAGRSVADTLAKIQHEEPSPLTERDPSAPAELQRIITKCLAKQRRRRYQHADDLIVDLRALRADVETGGAAPLAGVVADVPPATTRIRPLPVGVAMLLGALASAIVFSMLRPLPPVEVTRLSLEIDDGQRISSLNFEGFQRPGLPSFALSPAGRHIVYSATDGYVQRLYLRALDERQATPIPGTEGAYLPFFSPNGQWIGFFDYADLGIKRVPVGGGSVELVNELEAGAGFGSWTDDDTILFSYQAAPPGVFEVPANGGTPVRLTTTDPNLGEVWHLFPQMLPGRRALLFTVMDETEVPSRYDIVVQDLATEERSVLIDGGSDARFLPSGHVVFMRDGNLMAVAFDVETLATTTEPIVVIEDVMHAEGGSSDSLRLGAGQFSVSSTGSLAFATGGIFPESLRALGFTGADGVQESLSVPSAVLNSPRVSPDGTRVAYARGPTGARQIWVYDVDSRTPQPLTSEGTSSFPEWSPDGTRIVFQSADEGEAPGLFWMEADGSGEPQRITQGARHWVASWSSDGFVVYLSERGHTEGDHRYDIMFVNVDEDSEPEVFLQTPFLDTHPVLSPNGRWLAYASDEAGVREVWVRAFPESEAAYRISTEGGTEPVWSRDGRRLFYKNQGAIWVVDVTAEAEFSRDTEPRLLLEGPFGDAGPTRGYDVAPDGRFVTTVSTDERHEDQPVTRLNIVLNWFEELKERVPTGR